MTPEEKIARLEELERRERQGQRKASRIAWGSTGLAALTLGAIVLLASYELSAIRAEIARLEEQRAQLFARNAQLDKENNLKERALWQLDSPPSSDGGQALARPSVPAAPVAPAPAPPLQPSTSGSARMLPRVYTHIAEREDREFANRVGRALTDRNYVVLGPEYKPEAGKVTRTQVRYYKHEDAGTAEAIAAALRQAGADAPQTVYLRRYEHSTAVRPNVFEVWFPPNVAEARRGALSRR
jgi:hypothetical protein